MKDRSPVPTCSPVLARWRLNLGMSTAIERIDDLGQRLLRQGEEAKEALSAELATISRRLTRMSEQMRQLDHAIARRFSEEQRRAAVERYRELARHHRRPPGDGSPSRDPA